MINDNKKLNICLIEPFYSGSHKKWADEYQKYSYHNIEILSLKGIYWKWRMHGGAITLAEQFNKKYHNQSLPDIIITTDMLKAVPTHADNINQGRSVLWLFESNEQLG